MSGGAPRRRTAQRPTPPTRPSASRRRKERRQDGISFLLIDMDTRAYTIFGGTAEIQHDIIARSVIGR